MDEGQGGNTPVAEGPQRRQPQWPSIQTARRFFVQQAQLARINKAKGPVDSITDEQRAGFRSSAEQKAVGRDIAAPSNEAADGDLYQQLGTRVFDEEDICKS